MQPNDADERLLEALRGRSADVSDPTEVEDLAMAERIGTAARAHVADPIETPVPDDLFVRLDAAIDEPPPVIAPVAPPASNRRRNLWVIGAVAVAVAFLGPIIATVVTSRTTSDPVAEAQLEALVGEGEASARLVEADGGFELEVDLDGVDPGSDYLELWLLNGEVTELLSLGPIQSDGSYRLPDGLDPAELPVVDVSIESFDGDPTHSGNSVFRGTLDL